MYIYFKQAFNQCCEMTTTAVRTPVCSAELGGSGLAGARHLRDEREKRRRARTRQAFGGRAGVGATASSASVSGSPGFGYADGAAPGRGGPSPRAPKVSPRQRRRIEDTHAYLCAKVDPVMGELILALVEGRPKNVRQAALDHLLSKKRHRTGTAAADTPAGAGATVAGSNDGDDGNLGRDRPSSQQKYHRETNGRKKGDNNKAHTNNGGIAPSPAAVAARRLAERKDRLFMAREIGPLVTELISRTLRRMPTEVEDFLVEQLQGIASVARQRGDGSDSHGLQLDIRTSQSRSAGGFPGESDKDRPNGDESEQPLSARPSTARSRLEQARNLDQQAQETLLPLAERAGAGARTSSDASNIPKSVNLSDGSSCVVNGDASLSLERENVVAIGVKESLNKPWDMEVRRALC